MRELQSYKFLFLSFLFANKAFLWDIIVSSLLEELKSFLGFTLIFLDLIFFLESTVPFSLLDEQESEKWTFLFVKILETFCVSMSNILEAFCVILSGLDFSAIAQLGFFLFVSFILDLRALP